MDRSEETGKEEDEVMVVGTGSSPGTGVEVQGKRATRRCTQQKLTFGGSPGTGKVVSEESGRENKGKEKGNVRLAATKKALPIKKDVPGSSKASDFFTRVSEKRLQQKHGRIGLEYGVLTSESADFCEALQSPNVSKSPKKLKRCNEDSMTLKDMPDNLRRACSRRNLANDKSHVMKIPGPESTDKCQPVLDLWLEAKTAAEENQRLFAGRQIHPFFSSGKVMREAFEASEITKAQNKCHSVLNSTFPPLHVTGTLEDDSAPLDWSKWLFNDEGLLGLNGYSLEGSSVICENYELPLKVGIGSCVPCFHENLPPHREILLLDEASSLSLSSEVTRSPPTTSKVKDGQSMISIDGTIDQPIRCCISANNSREKQVKQLERSVPYQCSFMNSGHGLWTNKYQPGKASEVCGNAEAVSFISEWLKHWCEKGLQACNSTGIGKTMTIDVSDSSSESDYDTETGDECSQLRNVLLVTGPVGSGKSAAIYACAKEQGFEVIEVNASDQRNGSLIKQKFGEAVESHGLDLRSIDDHINNQKTLEYNIGLDNNIADKEIEDDNVKVVSARCKQDLKVFGNSRCHLENKAAICQVTTKSLILFEDVDTVFDDDRGFISAILQLAETSKRPIILTSNSKNPTLPQVLDRETVEFRLPSHEELLSHVSMISAAEGNDFSAALLKKIIKLCQSDVRKTITQLQFWCQGKRELGGNEQKCFLLTFDLDAIHLALPKLIPWGFPCKLSERIAMEVAKTSYSVSVNENAFFSDMEKQQDYKSIEIANSLHVNGNEAITVTNNKDDMATCQPFISCDDLSFKSNEALSAISESPLKFVSRSRQRHRTVLSSDSDGEQENEPPTPDQMLHFNDIVCPDVSVVAASQIMDDDNRFNLNDDMMDHSTKNESCQPLLLSPETSSPSYMFDMHKSLDASCVPESNLVPGTESNHELDFSSSFLPSNSICGSLEKAFMNKAMPTYELPESRHGSLQNNIIDLKTHLLGRVENIPFFREESVHGNEEPHDLGSGNACFLTRDCQLMDECSRADFCLGISKDTNNCFGIDDKVLGTWRNLRNQRDDLKSYFSSEKNVASQALKYCSGMTSLISDTDIMLCGCESFLYNHIESIFMLYAEPVSMTWCDERMEMSLTFAQYGLSVYAHKSKKLGSEFVKEKPSAMTQEMFLSGNNTMEFEKQLSTDSTASEEWYNKTVMTGMSSCHISFIREAESKIYGAILPIVPERLCMVIKGHAFLEYSSFLSLISKTENARLVNGTEQQQRRRRNRACLHYLKSGSHALSSEEVTLLAQHCCFGEVGFP